MASRTKENESESESESESEKQCQGEIQIEVENKRQQAKGIRCKGKGREDVSRFHQEKNMKDTFEILSSRFATFFFICSSTSRNILEISQQLHLLFVVCRLLLLLQVSQLVMQACEPRTSYKLPSHLPTQVAMSYL